MLSCGTEAQSRTIRPMIQFKDTFDLNLLAFVLKLRKTPITISKNKTEPTTD